MTQPDLVPCNDPGYIKDPNIDTPPPFCREKTVDIDGTPIKDSLRDVENANLSWLEEPSLDPRLGYHLNCDPQQTGYIVNGQNGHDNANTIYRNSLSLMGTDDAMQDMFRNIVVIDPRGKDHVVPIIWGTQEKAVAWIIQENVRKDESNVVDRIRLPALAIHDSATNLSEERYTYHKAIDYIRDLKTGRPGFVQKEKYARDTVFGVSRGVPVDRQYSLYAWTTYSEDMTQIVEQVMQKCCPLAYIRVRGVSWEVAVKLDSVENNINYEPGDKAVRVMKYKFNLTAQTYISQPIVRRKAVLKTKVDITDSMGSDAEVAEIIAQLEQTVKELEE